VIDANTNACSIAIVISSVVMVIKRGFAASGLTKENDDKVVIGVSYLQSKIIKQVLMNNQVDWSCQTFLHGRLMFKKRDIPLTLDDLYNNLNNFWKVFGKWYNPNNLCKVFGKWSLTPFGKGVLFSFFHLLKVYVGFLLLGDLYANSDTTWYTKCSMLD